MMMPAPESRSTPGLSMSIALVSSAVRTCAVVNDGLADLIRAAIAAACGAAADVPKNGLGKLPTPVIDTPSAAVMSGLASTVPPVDERFPGVIGTPFAWKKIRRGPSELKVSTTSLDLNASGNAAPAGVAATPKEPSALVAA